MPAVHRFCLVVVLLGILCFAAAAQEKPPEKPSTPRAPEAAPEAKTGTAATVNGQPIPEKAVQRGLLRAPPEKQAEARAQVLDYLIDNVVLDQHLLQLGIDVPKAEVDARLQQIREEIQKNGHTFEAALKELMLSEEELRTQLIAELRWDKYAGERATDKALRELFDKNVEIFDGTMVRARHILLTPAAGDAKAAEQAKLQLQNIKQQIEETVAKELAKLPAGGDSLSRQKARNRALDDAFAAMAREKSACPSKAKGGDLDWFPRAGSLVEPFASAAFALKPYQMSDVVATPFGFHLILATGRRPGRETKFDEVKDVVKEVYCDRLRESLCADLKPKAKIVINPLPKP